MKIFTYGVREKAMEVIRSQYGQADYVDVTSKFQDILSQKVDKVIINTDVMTTDLLREIGAYVAETEAFELTEYIYITEDLIALWSGSSTKEV